MDDPDEDADGEPGLESTLEAKGKQELVVNGMARQVLVVFPDGSRVAAQGATMAEAVIGGDWCVRLLGLNVPATRLGLKTEVTHGAD